MAEALKLTETVIANAQLGPQQKQEVLWDAKIIGLGFRILASGTAPAAAAAAPQAA